jgi:uncharacterized membrane protein
MQIPPAASAVEIPAIEPQANPVAHPEATELLISNILRAGVLLSAALVILGTVITFARHRSYLTDSGQLDQLKDGSLGFPTSFPQIMTGLAHFEGRAIVMTGLLVLVATPILRVAISIVAFLQVRDRIFAGITSIVLMLLIASLTLGKAGG